MKKSILLVVSIFLLRLVSFSQEADLLYTPYNEMDQFSLEHLIDPAVNAGPTASFVVPVTPVNDPTKVIDLYHTVSVNLYFKTDDIALPPLQEEININAQLELVGTDMGGNANTVHTENGVLKLDALTDRSVLTYHFSKEELFPYNLHHISSASISFDKADLNGVSSAILEAIELQVDIKYARYDTRVNPVTNQFNLKFIDQDSELKTNEAIIYWDQQPQPTSYELEWIHIYEPSASGTVDYDFSKNAVRVQTKENYYPISLLYNTGYLVARVRTVRPSLNQEQTALLSKKTYGEWTLLTAGSFLAQTSLPSYVLRINLATTDQRYTTNWQYNASYSSEGKKKELMNVFDGSSRKRQSVTMLSDFNLGRTFSGGEAINYKPTILAQETYYDFNGTPVIELMGTPLPDANNYGFAYQTQINQSSGAKLSKSAYDSPNSNTSPQLDVSATEVGAAQYYSAYNQLYLNSGNEIMDYLPDASGYPFSRTELTKDGSGRVRVKYAAGSELANDNTKNTRYFYSKPTTSELEILFGTNVGEANFYKKNVVIDPNGVISMAYMDQKDRTIATSIAGDPNPRSQMVPLPHETVRTFTEDLLATGAERFIENDNSYELHYPIFVPIEGDYVFEYNMDIDAFSPFCQAGSICYECKYQFLFQIVDEEGTLVLESKDNDVSFNASGCTTQNFSIDHIDFQNGVTASITGSELTVRLETVKKYTIIKKLKLKLDDVEQLADQYVGGDECLTYDLNHFLNQELDNTDFAICRTEFETEEEVPSSCFAIREAMLNDFRYPLGYFVKDAPPTEPIGKFIMERLNVSVNRGSWVFEPYLNTDGSIDYTLFTMDFNNHYGLNVNADLTFADWDDKYMEYFLQFHPSHPKYDVCRSLNSPNSLKFDRLLKNSTTAAELVTALRANNLMGISDDFSFDNNNNLLTVPSSTPPSVVVPSVYQNGNGRCDHSLVFNKGNTYTKNVDVNEAYMNDFALLRFDSDFYLYEPYHSGIGFAPLYPALTHASYTGSIKHYKFLFPESRHCAAFDSADYIIDSEFYSIKLEYLSNYFGCLTTGSSAGEGVYEIAKRAQHTQGRWEMYKHLYANTKARLKEHFIQTAVWGKHPTLTSLDDNRYPDFDIHEYYQYEFYVGKPTEEFDYVKDSDPTQTSTDIRNDALDMNNLAEDVADLIDGLGLFDDPVNTNTNKNTFIANFVTNTTSASPTTNATPETFLCDPFNFIANNSTGLLISNADVYTINIASITTPYLRYYTQNNGSISSGQIPVLNPYFQTCSREKDQFNCYDFKGAVDEYIVQFGGNASSSIPFTVSSYAEIEIDDPDQAKFRNWVNWKLGLNLSFSDYFKMAENCVPNDGGTSYFGTVVDWGAPSTKIEAIKEAVIDIGVTEYTGGPFTPLVPSARYLTTMDQTTIETEVNALITNTSNHISLATDYIGFGAIDLTNSQYDFFYLENEVSTYTTLLTLMNDVYATIKTELHSYDDFEEHFFAHCIPLNLAQNGNKIKVINHPTLKIDRALRYSDGTVWVRLLNDDLSFYDDFYYYYEPYNHEYKLSDVHVFNGIQPIFDQESMHYVTLTTDEGFEMIAKTGSEITTALRIAQVELNNYRGEGWFPFDKGCEDIKYDDAKSAAKLKYEEYIEEERSNFIEEFTSFCLNQQTEKALSNREFKMTYTSSERHFTLYYYDQADNLVMTIPPKGANPLAYNTVEKQRIKDYRNHLSTLEVLPEHAYATKYKYNTDNQIIEQNTPNGGISHFWYDRVGRLVLSQNSEQQGNSKFSYTFYDQQSRITESGEVELNELISSFGGQGFGESFYNGIQAFILTQRLNGETSTLENLIKLKYRNDVSKTYYDTKVIDNGNLPLPPADFKQENLRSRVATQAYTSNLVPFSAPNWDFATHYSYDPVGNVKTILNDYYQGGLITLETDRFKRVDYSYDPVSGNVQRVLYQLGKEDVFIHQYEYDAENRIVNVKTSRDGIIWDKDADYTYYQHGPLARTELGEHTVQGVDYAYNLQGWLKAVNSGYKGVDMGNDQAPTSIAGSAEDAFGFSLNYFENDYTSVNSQANHLIAGNTGTNHSDLYNGNINSITSHNQSLSLGKKYIYDQLNRIKSADEHQINESSRTWGTVFSESNSTIYDYDKNGNLTSLDRFDGKSNTQMDDMAYNYLSGTDKLSHVDDNIALEAFPNDIDQQPIANYNYDDIGNLTADASENIQEIRWYPNGKVKRITRQGSPTKTKPDLFFEYDAMGNRVKKTVNFIEAGLDFYKTVYYVRDAQGNILANYDEVDCKFVTDPNDPGYNYYQYSEPFSFYTNEAVSQTSESILLNYLNDNFSKKLELCEQARLNLPLIPNSRDLIWNDLDATDYLDLNEGGIARVLLHDPYYYANDLYNNNLGDFMAYMNDKNEAWIQYLKSNSKELDFYNSYNSLYQSNQSAALQLSNAEHCFTMNRAIIVNSIADNSTLIKGFLRLSTSQYNEVYSIYTNPSNANGLLQNLFLQLDGRLAQNEDNAFVEDLILRINGILMVTPTSSLDLNFILGQVNMSSFYSGINYLSSTKAEILNSILHHVVIIGNWNTTTGIVNTTQLLAYAPTDAMDWSVDASGEYLEKYIHTDEAHLEVRNIAAFYFNTVNMSSSDIYFNGSQVWPYVNEALQRNSETPTVIAAVYNNEVHTKSILYHTEDIEDLANYLKIHYPYKVLLHNYNHDALQKAFMEIIHYSPLKYAEELEANLGVNFGTPLGCTTHLVSLLPTSYELYGSSRLGRMDAKSSRSNAANSYQRKLKEKTYELSDHLGNVVATVSDKKYHPLEILPPGAHSPDPNMGYQADVTGRYDYYPFGMEIMSRSGTFSLVDHIKDGVQTKYEGLLECDDYYQHHAVGNNDIDKVCTIETNLYGVDYLSSLVFEQTNPEFYTDHFNLKFDPLLNMLLPNLDPAAEYQIEIHVSNTVRRTIKSRMRGPGNADWVYGLSESAGLSIPHTMIALEDEKVIILKFTGQELIEKANYGSGRLKFDFYAGRVNAPNSIDYKEIVFEKFKVSKILNDVTTPLTERTSDAYAYGFNGKERQDEVSGSGNNYDYGFRIYDPRLARFSSVDPLFKSYPWLTPYQFAANTPIMAIDLDGLEAKLAIYGVGAGDEPAFKARAIRLATTLNSNHVTIHGTMSGSDFVELLRTKSNSEGSIASFTMFSHAFQSGVMMNSSEGFYTRSDKWFGGGINAAYVDDVVSGINDGSIRFEENAIAVFGGCNCAGSDGSEVVGGLATDFTEKTGVTTIASQGSVSPEIVDGKETGNLISDQMFFRFDRLEDGTIQQTELGKVITPADYDVDITMQPMPTRGLQPMSSSDDRQPITN